VQYTWKLLYTPDHYDAPRFEQLDHRPTLKVIDVPCLNVYGGMSKVFPKEGCESLALSITNCQNICYEVKPETSFSGTERLLYDFCSSFDPLDCRPLRYLGCSLNPQSPVKKEPEKCLIAGCDRRRTTGCIWKSPLDLLRTWGTLSGASTSQQVIGDRLAWTLDTGHVMGGQILSV
jgi:hypothetical protein